MRARGGGTFSLQLVGESIKEEIDMTANAVTHQTLCVSEERQAQQQMGPFNVLSCFTWVPTDRGQARGGKKKNKKKKLFSVNVIRYRHKLALQVSKIASSVLQAHLNPPNCS